MPSRPKISATRRRRTTAIPSFFRPIDNAVRNADVNFCAVPQGGKPFSPYTNRPQIMLICEGSPQAVHQDSLRNFVKRCTGAVIYSGEPPEIGYALAAARAAKWRQDVIIVAPCAEHEADWKHALDAINPDLAYFLWLVGPVGGVQ